MSTSITHDRNVSDQSLTPSRTRRVALVAGWTGGHVYPALALAEALTQKADSPEIIFLGTADAIEASLVPRHGYQLETIDALPMMGVSGLDRLRAGAALVRGVGQARHLLKRHKVDLVVGFGGYVTPSVLIAAWTLRLPTAIHEANMVPGRANRLLARLVDHVFLNWSAAAGYFPKDKSTVTGHPVRRALTLLGEEAPKIPPRGDTPLRVLVTGGSIGMSFLDSEAPRLCSALKNRGIICEVLHQCSEHQLAVTRAAYESSGQTAEVTTFLDDMAAAYGWADFAITGSGAGTLAELAFAGLPALLVPLASASDDHQRANAQAFVEATGALCCSVSDWDVDWLGDQIQALVTDGDRWSTAARGMRRLADPGVADRLADHFTALMDRP